MSKQFFNCILNKDNNGEGFTLHNQNVMTPLKRATKALCKITQLGSPNTPFSMLMKSIRKCQNVSSNSKINSNIFNNFNTCNNKLQKSGVSDYFGKIGKDRSLHGDQYRFSKYVLKDVFLHVKMHPETFEEKSKDLLAATIAGIFVIWVLVTMVQKGRIHLGPKIEQMFLNQIPRI